MQTARIPQLDGFRALAFLAVFLNHALNVPFLWFGVDAFFVLSGFLITGILLREAEEAGFSELLRRFYTRRGFRILIPYFVLLLLVTLFVESDWLSLWPYYVFFGQNFAVAFYGGQGAVNPLWSLGVEEQFYLVWPFMIFALSAAGLKRLCWVLILVAMVLRIAATYWTSNYLVTFCLTPFRMDLLAAGALLALTVRSGGLAALDVWRGPSVIVGVSSAVVFVFLAATHELFRAKTNSLLFNGLGYPLVLLMCVSALNCALTSNSGLYYRVLTSPPMRYIGTISFMCYMVHAPILRLMHNQPGAIRAIGSLTATIAFATVTWYGFEKRCIRFARGLTSEVLVSN